MKVVEVLKIFGYIFVLMLCFALMQGLSTLEYNLREDKSVTYEMSWAEDLGSASEDKRWTLRGDNIRFEKKQLILELHSDGVPQLATAQFPEIVDSGYVSIKAILPKNTLLAKSSIILYGTGGEALPLEITETEAATQEWRSKVLSGKDLASVALSLTPGQSLDSVTNYQLQSMVIESIQFMKQVQPKKLF